jgi:aspartyl protease
VIIPGRFVGGAPYFDAHLRSPHFHGLVSFLADTGASRTTLLDRDAQLLSIPAQALTPASQPVVGIGGSVRSFQVRNVEITLASDQGDVLLRQELWIVQHDLAQLAPKEAARILRIPSVLGRDVLSQFRFTCDYQAGIGNRLLHIISQSVSLIGRRRTVSPCRVIECSRSFMSGRRLAAWCCPLSSDPLVVPADAGAQVRSA